MPENPVPPAKPARGDQLRSRLDKEKATLRDLGALGSRLSQGRDVNRQGRDLPGFHAVYVEGAMRCPVGALWRYFSRVIGYGEILSMSFVGEKRLEALHCLYEKQRGRFVGSDPRTGLFF